MDGGCLWGKKRSFGFQKKRKILAAAYRLKRSVEEACETTTAILLVDHNIDFLRTNSTVSDPAMSGHDQRYHC